MSRPLFTWLYLYIFLYIFLDLLFIQKVWPLSRSYLNDITTVVSVGVYISAFLFPIYFFRDDHHRSWFLHFCSRIGSARWGYWSCLGREGHYRNRSYWSSQWFVRWSTDRLADRMAPSEYEPYWLLPRVLTHLSRYQWVRWVRFFSRFFWRVRGFFICRQRVTEYRWFLSLQYFWVSSWALWVPLNWFRG